MTRISCIIIRFMNERTITPYDGSNIWYPSSMMGKGTMYFISLSSVLNVPLAIYLNNKVGIIGGTESNP